MRTDTPGTSGRTDSTRPSKSLPAAPPPTCAEAGPASDSTASAPSRTTRRRAVARLTQCPAEDRSSRGTGHRAEVVGDVAGGVARVEGHLRLVVGSVQQQQ